MKYPAILILASLGVVSLLPASADTLTVSASADTWLFAAAPDTAEFGDFHGLAAGVNSGFPSGSPMRALIKFDLSSLPAGATVTSASVTIAAIKQNFSANTATFELHRVLNSWVAAEATWNSRSSGVAWSSGGGASGADFSESSSASQVVSTAGVNYTFGPTDQTLADIQAWISDPTANFGWMLKVSDETVSPTSRRWGSNATGNPASLTVNYTVATPPQNPTISNVQNANNQLQFSFSAEANRSYTVETRPAFDSSTWTPLTTFDASSTPTNYLVTDPISQVSKFYRVKTP